MRFNFDAENEAKLCVNWIREFFKKNGADCKAVIGISGGKDSSVVAGLCVEALGKDRVIGVLMPQGVQPDIDDSYKVVNALGIKSYTINIENAVDSILKNMELSGVEISEQSRINLPCRVRMSTLYVVSQSVNGRVANTCNLSENYIGYSTRWGDSVGDFAPLANLLSDEVVAIGKALDFLPTYLLDKVPSDGLCGKTDEDNFGFSYLDLNKYILTRECPSGEETAKKIKDLHEKNLFKMRSIPEFIPGC